MSFEYESPGLEWASGAKDDKLKVTQLLVESIVQIESGGNAKLVGKHGERGLMQLKKEAWHDMTRAVYGRKISFNRAFDPVLNKRIGAAYLSYLYEFIHKHKHDWKNDERSLLLACYNAGPNRVRDAGFDLKNLSAQTQDYVTRATALHDWLLSEHALDVKKELLAQIPSQPANS